MSSMRNDLKPTKIEVQSRFWLTGLTAGVAALCASLPANAGVEPGENTRMVEKAAWRTVDADDSAVPEAGAIEVVAPIDDETLGVIIYRLEGDGRTHVLRFGGPR